ncbi:MAG: aminopeptidase [Promethearchaeota archaeon]|nr:MAG: aminopeptidase [Candidatus Lokiarchaeota archaeon]
MTSDFEINLEKYAEVVLKVAINLQPGQRLLIGAPSYAILGVPLELVPLIRAITKKAYQMGARLVDVMWEDYEIDLIRFQHAPNDSFEEYPNWRAEEAIKHAKSGEAILFVYSPDPDLFNGIDLNLISKVVGTCMKYYKPLLDLRHQNAMNYTIITPPISGWADEVFPNTAQYNRVEKFWETIFEICRVTQEDPISAWRNHINQLHSRCEYLNQKQYNALKMTGPGTDLMVGLIKEHSWKSGGLKTQNGINFVANFPTEEIMNAPHKDKTEGVVVTTKPLEVIEDLKLTFSEGKVVEATASKGEEYLQKFLETDGGATQLGEVALVPHSSPISQYGILFYNLLLDENASCHLALGQCLRPCIKDGEKMSDDDLLAVGGNISGIHLDFMVGSDKMNVDGITEDGTVEPIMRNGEWAFKV